ncbi:DeoR/GlpR transcriptional regulator [Spiroplasma chinense]|uniref:DeoR/GlpR transcriptional regulator n=1 Tax=Spiroplasma chinense TaxID=216932 RepID=A0A5B9Y457_9MOLU|nr:DeoR/GlpR family DNA-binding transcription regulator [Spiroplasma chinense]QEH61459.1 DeoR/GlpR transcriptional regulator [Spiroplasma chinense]
MSDKRLNIIIDILREKNITSTNTILKMSKQLGVSKITLRRDLHELEEKNIIRLSYGKINVISEEYIDNEITGLDHRNKERMDQKNSMANEANEVLEGNDIIFVSMGTTCEHFVSSIKKKVKFLITNSLSVGLKATKNINIERVFVVGGTVDKNKKSSFLNVNFDFLNDIYIDKVFTSCVGISSDGDVFFDTLEESKFIKRICSGASKHFLFIDDYKMDKKSLVKTFNKDEFNKIFYFDNR